MYFSGIGIKDNTYIRRGDKQFIFFSSKTIRETCAMVVWVYKQKRRLEVHKHLAIGENLRQSILDV